MPSSAVPPPPPSSPTALSALLANVSRRWQGTPLWIALVALVITVQAALLWLTWQQEQSQRQEEVDAAAVAVSADVRQRLLDNAQAMQRLLWEQGRPDSWLTQAAQLLRERPELLRVERRAADFSVVDVVVSAIHPAQFQAIPRSGMSVDAEIACAYARRFASPSYSRTYFLPNPNGLGLEVVDLCIPLTQESNAADAVVVTLGLSDLLRVAIPAELVRRHEVLLVEADGTRLARTGSRRGAGVFIADRLVDVSGFTAVVRLNSLQGVPRLIPNLSAALAVLLSVALGVVILLLVHDMRRRSAAEQALAEALTFRKAMEDSLVTGLRARTPDGRITYVNPAFCQMVGYEADELLQAVTPPYWPPEMAALYTERQRERNAGNAPPREGHETVFMRRDGERFPVLIFEAPLVDARGRPNGWMSTVLDVSAQRRMEELSRQQQDKLQAAARLATMGEMATLLSHELNQPLAAIASYATGSLNLMPETPDDPPADLDTQLMIRQAVARIAEQAERAGRVIRSVHQFVRRRERLRENVRAGELIEAVLPLVRLTARRSNTRIEVDVPEPPPRVSCDRTMVEQVLLNLARNGIQAMEEDDTLPLNERMLRLEVRQTSERWISFGLTDHGPGIPDAVARQLFTPFFSTKPEGMGIGLAMCRTVIEQHGGALDFSPGPDGRGTTFRFTLPSSSPVPPPPTAPIPSPPP
ncbi:two-component system sensor histidine kinase NtrB [Sphaerotilus sp.]|uniref:two-component system sensor histidine kinase NtrB n=1 Tax=Sphaerotilus sp. TaxID=2093942 RepID=UPI002ACDCA4E|nr:ATP-binding protein [Sphaerotilus sp.]MDZ7858849.1 PAS domain S-box protein [Sphaerotilus sp.]